MSDNFIHKNGSWPSQKKFSTVTRSACSSSSHWPTGEISDSKSLLPWFFLSETWLTDHEAGKKWERWTMKYLLSQIKRMDFIFRVTEFWRCSFSSFEFYRDRCSGWVENWRAAKTGDGETNIMLLTFSFLSICNLKKKNVSLWWTIRVSQNSASRGLVK